MQEVKLNNDFSIAQPHPQKLNGWQKTGLFLSFSALTVFFLNFFNIPVSQENTMQLAVFIGGIFFGVLLYTYGTYAGKPAGIKNNGVWFNSLTSRGVLGWITGAVLTTFYVLLYWFPEMLGLSQGENTTNTGVIALFDPLSKALNGNPATQWFMYGTIYTLLVLAFGIKFIVKYRHNRYQTIRTIVVILSQLVFAYFIPEILEGLNDSDAYFAKDLKYFWPLNYYFFEDWHLNNMLNSGTLGMFYLVWGIFMFAVFTPIITYFVGKRWYCSWVCGCGGLAETAGDSFRHLSSKTLKSWKIERWMIYSILLYISIETTAVLYGYFMHTNTFLGLDIYTWFKRPYGFLIGAMFSGVIGVGFYPLLGNRVWCRFGCPLAGYMGIIQRFKSRFRITTNGGQCISCGNCSTYCEQGIDVRSYAQKGQNIVRASCVGCGICTAVCPRGVLKLENGPEENRIKPDTPFTFGNESIKINHNSFDV